MAFDWLAIFCPEYPELDVDLNLAARSMDFAEPCSPPYAVQAIALEDTGYTGSRDLDVVIARQVSNDAHGSQAEALAQVKNLLDDLRQCLVPGGLGDWLPANQGGFTMLLERRLPSVKTGSANAEVPTGTTNMHHRLDMPQDPQPALNLAIFRGHHRYHPSPIGL